MTELRNELSLIDFHVVLSKILFMNEIKLIDIIMIIESLAWLIELLNASMSHYCSRFLSGLVIRRSTCPS